MPLLFRQLFDAQSSTYSYILADPATREAVLIDPVFEQAPRAPDPGKAWPVPNVIGIADRAEIEGMLEYLVGRACRTARELGRRTFAPGARRRRWCEYSAASPSETAQLNPTAANSNQLIIQAISTR